jgi:hypothetical protein
MTTERRRSPKRKILEIKKLGPWGDISYHHVLSCGHTEIRKRASSTKEIACPWCLRAAEKNNEIKALTRIPSSRIESEDELLANDEVRIERIRASLASRFAIPVDAVDVHCEDVSGQLIIKSATIFLSGQDVTRAIDQR